jgi:hypothetical protein
MFNSDKLQHIPQRKHDRRVAKLDPDVSRTNEANALRGAERRAIARGDSSTALLLGQDAFLAENNVTSWFEFIVKDTVNT